ncbi:MAG: flagellin [Rhizobiaceae bacterium]
MDSIRTNTAAMVALRTLQDTNVELEKVQAKISTGYKISEAKDNAAYWAIATTMRSDHKALTTVQDALGLGAAKIEVTYTALNSAIKVVDEIKSRIVAAREPGVDSSKIQDEIVSLQGQLMAIASSASFSGENWLSVDSASASYSQVKSIVASFNRTATGVQIETIDIDTANLELFDAADQSGIADSVFTTTGAGAVTVSLSTLDVSAAGLDSADLDDMISQVDAKLAELTSSASNAGAIKKRISMQTDFVKVLLDTIEVGIGTLVDADISAESTRLQALQTQQQLGIQALSIANSSAQNILALFRQ